MTETIDGRRLRPRSPRDKKANPVYDNERHCDRSLREFQFHGLFPTTPSAAHYHNVSFVNIAVALHGQAIFFEIGRAHV